jgi:uncharacterized protein HemX
MMRWFRRKKIAEDLKTVTEVAGDQLAPGAGTLILVLGAALAAGAGAYYVSQTRQKKKAALLGAASSKSDKSA